MAEHEGGGGGSNVVRELLAIFGFQVDTESLHKGESELNHFFEKIKSVAERMAAVFVIDEIGEFVEHTVEAMHAVERSSAMLGISTDKVQAYQYAAKALGEESGTLLDMMGRLQVAQQAAAAGTGAQGQAFAALGVKVKDASGHMKAADELFEDVAEGIAKIEDPSKRAAEVTKLFGRQGRQLLPVLAKGKDGIRALLDEYRELGGGYIEEAIELGRKFEHKTAKLNLAFLGIKNTIMRGLLPAYTWLVDKTADLVKWFSALAKNSYIVQAVLLVAGAAATYFGAQMLIASWPVIAVAGALAAIVLAVDEIITTFQGGDSLIKRSIDALFGEGQTAQAVLDLKAAWKSVSEYIEAAGKSIGEMVGAYKFFVEMRERQENEENEAAKKRLGAEGFNYTKDEARVATGKYDKWGTPIYGPSAENVTHAPQSLPYLPPPPGSFQSLPLGGALQSSGGTVVNIDNLNVTPPAGADAYTHGREVMRGIASEAARQERRDAAARRPRARSPQ